MERDCPYRDLPDHAVWRQAVGRRPIETILPIDAACQPIRAGARVASAGSCFAQRIAENLPALGLEYCITEPGPTWLAAEDRRRLGYGTYSARYGNIYTPLQLAQLIERAYGVFTPDEPVWSKGPDRFVDPFRPGIDNSGFVSVEECLEDRRQHLSAVRTLIETAEVFVFTLGLTEAWISNSDGAVFPVCPGCGHGGTFDANRYEFVNFGVGAVTSHLERFLALARRHNPDLRLILSVSPVPLLATFSGQHVLTATTASKSVLRAACDEFRRQHDGVDYFASYEIVQAGGPQWAFAADRRSVTPAAVAHVMECFGLQFDLPLASTAGGSSLLASTGAETLIPRPTVQCDEDEILHAMAKDRRER